MTQRNDPLFIFRSDAGSHDDPAMSVHFHIMLLQLLIMLAADNDVMNKPVRHKLGYMTTIL